MIDTLENGLMIFMNARLRSQECEALDEKFQTFLMQAHSF